MQRETCLVNWLWANGDGNAFGMCADLDPAEQSDILHRLQDAEDQSYQIEVPTVVPLAKVRATRQTNLHDCAAQLRNMLTACGVSKTVIDHAFERLDDDPSDVSRPDVEIRWIYDDGSGPELMMAFASLSQREEETLRRAMETIEYQDDRIMDAQAFMPILRPDAMGLEGTAEELAGYLENSSAANDNPDAVEEATRILKNESPQLEPA